MRKVMIETAVLSHLNDAQIEMQSGMVEQAQHRVAFVHWLIFHFSDRMSDFIDMDKEWLKFNSEK